MGIIVKFKDLNTVFSDACGANLISRQVQSIYAILSGDVLAPNRGEIHPVTWLHANMPWIKKMDSHFDENDTLIYTGTRSCDHVEISRHNEYAIKFIIDHGLIQGKECHYIPTTYEYSDSQRSALDVEFDIYDLLIRQYNPDYGEYVDNYDTIFNVPQGRYSTLDIDYLTNKVSILRTLTVQKEYLR